MRTAALSHLHQAHARTHARPSRHTHTCYPKNTRKNGRERSVQRRKKKQGEAKKQTRNRRQTKNQEKVGDNQHRRNEKGERGAEVGNRAGPRRKKRRSKMLHGGGGEREREGVGRKGRRAMPRCGAVRGRGRGGGRGRNCRRGGVAQTVWRHVISQGARRENKVKREKATSAREGPPVQKESTPRTLSEMGERGDDAQKAKASGCTLMWVLFHHIHEAE